MFLCPRYCCSARVSWPAVGQGVATGVPQHLRVTYGAQLVALHSLALAPTLTPKNFKGRGCLLRVKCFKVSAWLLHGRDSVGLAGGGGMAPRCQRY
jgi:hypothetical protein